MGDYLNKHDGKSKMEVIQELAELIDSLGWVMALPTDEIVPGLIIGEKDFVMDVVKQYYGDGYEVLEKDQVSGFADANSFEAFPEQEEAVEIVDLEKKKNYH